jgi:4-hydroxy-3-polyprenylbenzoate decarboxylase
MLNEKARMKCKKLPTEDLKECIVSISVPQKLVIGITGASGACYAAGLIRFLSARGDEIIIIFSEPAKTVWQEELNLDLRSVESIQQTVIEELGIDGKRVTVLENNDFTAPICSGSHSSAAMVVIPCSMGTLGRIATGVSLNLIERAADVVLKEGKKLILVPRETPLNRIHLKNMLRINETGGIILPAMPAYYHQPKGLDEIIDFVIGKVLDQLEINHNLYRRWKE